MLDIRPVICHLLHGARAHRHVTPRGGAEKPVNRQDRLLRARRLPGVSRRCFRTACWPVKSCQRLTRSKPFLWPSGTAAVADSRSVPVSFTLGGAEWRATADRG